MVGSVYPGAVSPTEVSARRAAALVAGLAGLGLVPWFWVTQFLTELPTESPPSDAPAGEFVTFYADNLSHIPARTTMFTIQWVMMLVAVVAMNHAANRRRGLAGGLAVTLGGVATAVYVVTEGIGAWPVLIPDVTAADLAKTLDPGVAQALVMSREGLHCVAAVVLGCALIATAVELARSDLWAHKTFGVISALCGLGAMLSLFAGVESLAPGTFVLWGPLVGVLALIARGRLGGHAPVSAETLV